MSDQRHYTDQEWQTWRSTAGQTTPRWPSALGADREAQSYDWPSAAQPQAAGRCRLLQIQLAPCIAMLSLMTLTDPLRTPALRQPAPCLAAVFVASVPLQQVLTWTVPTHREPCTSTSTDPSGTSPLQRTTLCPGSPCIPPPPPLTVPPVHQVPHGFVPLSLPPFPPPPRLRLYPHHRCRMPVPPERENKPPSTMPIAQRANPFESRRPLCFLCHVLVSPSPAGLYQRPHALPVRPLCAPVEPRPSAQKAHTNSYCSLRPLPCCDP